MMEHVKRRLLGRKERVERLALARLEPFPQESVRETSLVKEQKIVRNGVNSSSEHISSPRREKQYFIYAKKLPST